MSHKMSIESMTSDSPLSIPPISKHPTNDSNSSNIIQGGAGLPKLQPSPVINTQQQQPKNSPIQLQSESNIYNQGGMNTMMNNTGQVIGNAPSTGFDGNTMNPNTGYMQVPQFDRDSPRGLYLQQQQQQQNNSPSQQQSSQQQHGHVPKMSEIIHQKNIPSSQPISLNNQHVIVQQQKQPIIQPHKSNNQPNQPIADIQVTPDQEIKPKISLTIEEKMKLAEKKKEKRNEEVNIDELDIDTQIAMIKKGKHPILIETMKELENQRDDSLWTIETWKKYQIESIEKQADVLTQQAHKGYKTDIEREKKRLIGLLKQRKKRDERPRRRRRNKSDNSTQTEEPLVEFKNVQQLSNEEIEDDILAIQQGIITI